MKNFSLVFALFIMFFAVSCGGDSAKQTNESDSGDHETNLGKLGGECYPDKTCDEGLICNTDNNICVETSENPTESSSSPCGETSCHLVWSSRPPKVMALYDAESYCENLEEGGYNNWHLPNINELRTLIQNCPHTETGGICAVSDPDHLFVSDNYYCNGCGQDLSGKYSKLGDTESFLSSSTLADHESEFAWRVYFNTGGFSYYDRIGGGGHFRCVRSDSKPECIKAGGTWNDAQISCTMNCSPKPEHAEWNGDSSYTLKNNGGWSLQISTRYSEDEGTCHFKCKNGYGWNGSECEFNFKLYTDPASGLTWSLKVANQMKWQDASDYCESLKYGGYDDWRLPNINELRRVIQNCPDTEPGGSCAISDPDHLLTDEWTTVCGCGEEDLNGKFSKLGDIERLWSSSLTREGYYAWTVTFDSAFVYYDGTAYDSGMYVRCVR